MTWYVLRNRRHVGPFGETDLQRLLKAGKISLKDYLLSKEDADKGVIEYAPLYQILKMDQQPSVITDGKWPQVDRRRGVDNLPPPPREGFGSESEGSTFREEVTKLFEDQLTPMDLVNINLRRHDDPHSSSAKSAEARAGNSVQMLMENITQNFGKTFSLNNLKEWAPWGFAVVVVLALGFYLSSDDRAVHKDPVRETAASKGNSEIVNSGGEPNANSSNGESSGSALSGDSAGAALRVPKISEKAAGGPAIRNGSDHAIRNFEPRDEMGGAPPPPNNGADDGVNFERQNSMEPGKSASTTKRGRRAINGEVMESSEDGGGPAPASEDDAVVEETDEGDEGDDSGNQDDGNTEEGEDY